MALLQTAIIEGQCRDLECQNSEHAASSIRVMVVEDFQSFRRFVCSKLEQRPELRVVCEVSDGLEAVQKAEELKPDLILPRHRPADIEWFGSCTTNSRLCAGIEDHLFNPGNLCLTSFKKPSRLGARGYVYKTHADGHLLPAIDAVLSGRQFVSCA